MAAGHVLLALVVACAAGTLVNASRNVNGRLLQQVNVRCPAGCASDGCVLDSTSGGYKCHKCLNALVVDEDSGKCKCPAGRYGTTNTCIDCDKGYHCAGGFYTAPNTPTRVICDTDLTTIGKRSISIRACVNVPGAFYAVDGAGVPSATTCPVNTYGPGLRKQRACMPCPPGYTTNGLTGRINSRACVVPPGYHLKSPGQVAPCPQGEYKAGINPDPSCTKCAAGVTTPTEASTSEDACTIVLPSFYPATITSGIVKLTQKCPQKYYCPGGTPTAAFDVSAPTTTAGTTVQQCASGTWTENIGSVSADQCLTPPGYFTSGGATTACSDGQYRPEWRPASAASFCFVCGANISSNPIEQITVYAITADATPSSQAVRATSASCYIKAGQGMYFTPSTATYRAVNCDSNSYGAPSITYSLSAFPCRNCQSGMQTSTDLTNSAAHWAADGPYQGFTDPLACVTKSGFGYNGRMANKCAPGSYNAAGNYDLCTQCPAGLSTPDDASQQVSISNCAVAVGYGFHDNAVVACPIGTYNDVLRANTVTPCTNCPSGQSTSYVGGRSTADCNVCAEGYGGSGCSTVCGGASATYGAAGRTIGSACEECPGMTTGYYFDYLAVNQNFTPATVAASGASSAADCLTEFTQIADNAWYLGDAASLTTVSGATTLDACVDDCKADVNCQYITFDYDGPTCAKKSFSASSTNGDVLAFKAALAGDTSATSTKAKGKALPSGSYTFWKDVRGNIGTSTTSGPTTSYQACLTSCDSDFDCAAVAMTGVNLNASSPGYPTITSCSLIKGDTTIATFKRTLTKTWTSRLSVTVATAAYYVP